MSIPHLNKPLKVLDVPVEEPEHFVLASSFADPRDIAAFRLCKDQGHSDKFCFSRGDNGIGLWGDDTTVHVPICALPYEVWLERWGSKAEARSKKVLVRRGAQFTTCYLRDTMPHLANIKNGCGIDLNPEACKQLGLTPPMKANVSWKWIV